MIGAADRHLLFGLLALQNGLINQDQLLLAFRAWTLDKSRSVADHLEARGDLTRARRALLEGLADVHLEAHGGDVEKSLAAVPAGKSARESLARLGDPEIDETLGHVDSHLGSTVNGDGDGTVSYVVGTSTFDGQRFRVLRPHARGGLGAVFVALDSELNREVALKQILDQHADDPTSRQRFVLEAEVTGGLEHPGIVPVYSLGSYVDGRPYYAMRFIRGDSLKEVIDHFHRDESLKKYPGRQSLELRKMLQRFIDVCNAIGYAHSRGVLHRDIKPANIIVGKHGETLVVDWGLAKSVGRSEPDVDSGERTFVPTSGSGSADTLPGSALGTPAYMSPEQAEGALERLGPRSDVYSLGATLYYILTGNPAFEKDDIGEMLRTVQRGDFPPPRQRDATIDRALEAVCLKAMARLPADRYPSPKGLSEDLERWLADEPISACHEPLSRRARRWARRNRTAMTAAAVALMAGVVGLASVLVVQTNARAEVTRALGRETSANAALAATNKELSVSKAAVQARYELAVEAIKTFHTGVSEDFLLKEDRFKELRDRLLKSASDFYGRLGALLGRESDTTARRALARANFELAELTQKVGRQEDSLAAHRAVLAARRELADAPGAGADDAAEVGRSITKVAGLLAQTGKMDEALAAHQEVEALLTGFAPSFSEVRTVLAESRSQLGALLSLTGKSAEALKAYRLARADMGELARGVAATDAIRNDLAAILLRTGYVLVETARPAEAEVEYRKALDIQRAVVDANPAAPRFRTLLADIRHKLGFLLSLTGRPADAEAQYREALEIYRGLSQASPAVAEFRVQKATVHTALGWALSRTGRVKEAEAEFRQGLALRREVAEADPAVTYFRSQLAYGHGELGSLLSTVGRPQEAEAEYREAMAIYRDLAEANPAVTEFRNLLAQNHHNLGNLLTRASRRPEAEKEYRQALSLQKALVEANPAVADFRNRLANNHNNLGLLLIPMGRRREAEAEHRAALTLYRVLADANPTIPEYRSGVAHTHLNLGWLHTVANQPMEAEADFRRALPIYRELVEANPAITDFRDRQAECHRGLAMQLARIGRRSEAESEFRRALAISQELIKANPTVVDFRRAQADSHNSLSYLLRQMGRQSEGEAELRRAIAIFLELAENRPAGTGYRNSAAQCRWNLALLLIERGRPLEAEAEYRAALPIFRELADRDPTVPGARDMLASGQTNLADVVRSLGRFAEAIEGYDRAIAIREALTRKFPETATYRSHLAFSLRRRGLARRAQGDLAGASADARRARELYEALPSPSAGEWCEIACCHAALAGLAGLNGSGISAGEGSDLADRAIESLRKAIDKGYRDRTAFRGEAAVEPLRNRPDFRLLVMDLVFPAEPFATGD
jgi:serine/threonine protein kinase/tetratricopeptide (TPR) repeat protein